MHRRCNRNRKRSKRRAIYCPIHECYLHSVTRRQLLLAPESKLQQQYGYLENVLTLVANEATAFLKDEWLEAFWCDECQQTNWYHIKKVDVNDAQTQSESITYQVLTALPAHWQQTISAIFPPELLLQQDYQQNS